VKTSVLLVRAISTAISAFSPKQCCIDGEFVKILLDALPFEKGTLEIEHNNSYNQFEVQ